MSGTSITTMHIGGTDDYVHDAQQILYFLDHAILQGVVRDHKDGLEKLADGKVLSAECHVNFASLEIQRVRSQT